MEVKKIAKTNINKTYHIKIKNFELSHKNLDLFKNDSIMIVVSRQNQSSYSSLYRNKKRFFLFYIQENDYEFPPLYKDGQAIYQFTQPGTYSILSYNYPKLKIQINVHEKKLQDNLTSTNLESASLQQQSVDNFLTSEDNASIFSLFNNNDKGLVKISRCLQLLNNGFSPDSIKEKYQDIFFHNKQQQNTNDKLQKRSESIKSLSKKSNSNKSKSKKSEAEEDFEDLRKVHELNKLNPDSLFSLLTKIKRKYIKEDDDLLKFDNVQQFTNYAKQQVLVDYNLKSSYKLKTLKKFQNKIFDRFNQIININEINQLKQIFCCSGWIIIIRISFQYGNQRIFRSIRQTMCSVYN